MTVMLAGPAGAYIDIPDDPLTTAARVAPNILFILDDSGSMAFDYMPDSIPATSTPNVARHAYTRNTLSYNPAVTYQPWMQADGTRMTGGTSYSAVYGSFNLVGGGTIDLGDPDSCRSYNYNANATTDEFWSGTEVCGGVQTYYVPKDPTETSAAYLGNGRNYYRYQILEAGSAIVRSEYGTRTSDAIAIDGDNRYDGTLSDSSWHSHVTGHVPAGQSLNLVISNRSSQGNRRFNYEVRDPLGNEVCDGQVTRGSSAECSVIDTFPGQYQIRLQRTQNNSISYRLEATASNSCDGGSSGEGWIGCVHALPNEARTLAEELQNYATWFSYHRTRIKSAKAGSSEAFSALDSKVRVGFRTIWDRSGSRFDIPVNDGNDGRFVDNVADPDIPESKDTNTRTTWFNRLHNVIGYNGTPLHGALDAAGRYFSDSSPSGPYGPQAGSNQYSCRQNFAILTTDGYWNSSSNYTGTLSSRGSWTGGVGEQDAVDGLEMTGPNNQRFQYKAGPPYASNDSGTLADVAMKYWKTDLRPDMTNNVPVTGANPAFWQHMVTFGISIGLSGTRGWRSVAEVPANATWPNPNDAEDADRIDDLLHAAVNSRGAFVSASNPAEFTEGLSAALSAIAQRTSSYSNVAANSVSLDAGTRVFNASYVSGTWTGALTARSVATGAEMWSASVPGFAERQNKVFTYTGATGATFPTATQVTSLTRTGGPANYAVSGEDNAKYLMGSVAQEERNGSGRLRNRTSLLGDIVHSSPAYVQDTDTLYVGANDGMLHAFSGSSGRELFAYVPNILNFQSLSTLSRPDYAHKYFVDGPVVVSRRSVTPDKNILVGTLGRGGKGLFALDVTNPSAFSTSDVMWERNSTPDGHMGLILGKPVIAPVATRDNAAIVANGVNSDTGQAALIVLDLSDGSVIREIVAVDSDPDAPNGLFAPTAVYGPDGRTVAFVYAGDLRGNVWKFDLRDEDSSEWAVSRLFTATDAEGRRQPITSALAVATNPRGFDRWVFFGTGRYLTVDDADVSNATPQSMYAFVEPAEGAEARLKSDLVERTIVETGTVNGSQVRGFQEREAVPAGKKGWFLDLPGTGERIVQDVQVASGYLVTASMMPTGDACEADGTGYINALDAFTGTSAGSSYFDLDDDGSTTDEVIGEVPIGSYNPGVGMPTLPNLLRGQLVVGGSGGGDVEQVATLRPRWDRVSWREITGE